MTAEQRSQVLEFFRGLLWHDDQRFLRSGNNLKWIARDAVRSLAAQNDSVSPFRVGHETAGARKVRLEIQEFLSTERISITEDEAKELGEIALRRFAEEQYEQDPDVSSTDEIKIKELTTEEHDKAKKILAEEDDRECVNPRCGGQLDKGVCVDCGRDYGRPPTRRYA